MMIYKTEDLIKDYHETIKEQYPDITFQEFNRICKNPFYYIRDKMREDILPLIHIKYLGKFLVFPKKCKVVLNYLGKSLAKGYISQEYYDKRKKLLLNYLKLNDEETYNEIVEKGDSIE